MNDALKVSQITDILSAAIKIGDQLVDDGFDEGVASLQLSGNYIIVSTRADHAVVISSLQKVGARIEGPDLFIDGHKVILRSSLSSKIDGDSKA